MPKMKLPRPWPTSGSSPPAGTSTGGPLPAARRPAWGWAGWRGRGRRRGITVAVIALFVLALSVTAGIGVLVPRSGSDQPGSNGAASPASTAAGMPLTAPVPLGRDEQYVRTRVLPSGELEVAHWIRSREPVERLVVSVPAGLAGEVGARDVDLDRGDSRPDVPRSLGSEPATYDLSGVTQLRLSYVLTGALDRRASVQGRALARVTTLDVALSPSQVPTTLSVEGPKILQLACVSGSEDGPIRPCGGPGEDGWEVSLPADSAPGRVIAQLDLS